MTATFIQCLITAFFEPWFPVVKSLAAHMCFSAGFRDTSSFLPRHEQQMTLLGRGRRKISTFLFHALQHTLTLFRVHPHLAQHNFTLLASFFHWATTLINYPPLPRALPHLGRRRGQPVRATL